jgi:hypothetical protein
LPIAAIRLLCSLAILSIASREDRIVTHFGDVFARSPILTTAQASV